MAHPVNTFFKKNEKSCKTAQLIHFNKKCDRNIKGGRVDMTNTIKYKGYTGSVEISEEDNCLFGKVLFIRSLLSYEGRTLEEIKKRLQGRSRRLLATL